MAFNPPASRPLSTRDDEGMEPDNYPSVEDEPLSQIELAAMAHWERFCPKLAAGLKAQGPLALETAIRAAWWKMEYLTELAMANDPTLHQIMAEEPYRELLWPPPESPRTQDTLPLITS